MMLDSLPEPRSGSPGATDRTWGRRGPTATEQVAARARRVRDARRWNNARSCLACSCELCWPAGYCGARRAAAAAQRAALRPATYCCGQML